MRYVITPEFHRNLWLKFTRFKLVAAPLIMGLLSWICLNSPNSMQNGALLSMSVTVYFIVALVWGNYEAGTALRDEIREKTWDFQRMSSITPVQLAFGKLFGVTSYVWYFSFFALMIFAYSYTVSGASPQEVLRAELCMIFSGVVGHAAAYLCSLLEIASGRTRIRGLRSGGAFVAGTFISIFVYQKTVPATLFSNAKDTIFDSAQRMDWFNINLGWGNFFLLSLAFFLFWIMVGIWRTARAELMYRATPVAWLLFLLTLGVYSAGLVSGEVKKQTLLQLCVFFVIALVLSYSTMLQEARDLRKYGRFIDALRRKDWRGTVWNMPRWVASLPLAIMAGFAAIFWTATQGDGFSNAPVIGMATLFLFAVRDGCVIHGIVLKWGDRQLSFLLLVYYLAVYLLLPAVHLIMLGNELSIITITQAPAQVGRIVAWYFPTLLEIPLDSLFPPLIECLGAGVWLYSSLKKKT